MQNIFKKGAFFPVSRLGSAILPVFQQGIMLLLCISFL